MNNPTVLGSPHAESLARYFGFRSALSLASTADTEVREIASNVSALADAALFELTGALKEIRLFEYDSRQSRLF